MTTTTIAQPVDFRLNTAAEIARLNTETLLDHLAELEADRRAGKSVEAAWALYTTEISRQREAGEFRLNTAADVARLSNETIVAHITEMDNDRIGGADEGDWYLVPIHEAFALYEAEISKRREAGDTFWPAPANRDLVALEDGDELPL